MPHCSFNELQRYVEQQTEFLQLNDDELEIAFSQRTLQRDIKEIRNLFGVKIQFNRGSGGYFISESETENANFRRMIEAYDMLNILNLGDDLKDMVNFENKVSLGSEFFSAIIHAIKKSRMVEFIHKKFDVHEGTKRIVQPVGLKEYHSRWYLIARDTKDNVVKSFGLERISELHITRQKFESKNNPSLQSLFQNNIGVSNAKSAAQKIVLQFSPSQSHYIKTLPLHHSQQIISETKTSITAEYFMEVNYELLMELLSMGSNVKVLKPASLQKQITAELKKNLDQYN